MKKLNKSGALQKSMSDIEGFSFSLRAPNIAETRNSVFLFHCLLPNVQFKKKQKVFLFLSAFPAVWESSIVCLALLWNISSRHMSAAWPLRHGSEFHSYLVWDMWLLSWSAFQFYRIRVWNTFSTARSSIKQCCSPPLWLLWVIYAPIIKDSDGIEIGGIVFITLLCKELLLRSILWGFENICIGLWTGKWE